MTIELWLTFVATSSLMLVIPGPTIITVLAYAGQRGASSILPLVCAVCLGDATLIAASLIGLGSILAVSSIAFNIIKVVGGAYLIWLGFKMLKSSISKPKASEREGTNQSASHSRNSYFRNTYLVTALNPKGIVFFGAFLPQFVNVDLPMAPQLSILVISFILLAALNTFCYAFLATKASKAVAARQTSSRFELAGGLALVSAGAYTLSVET